MREKFENKMQAQLNELKIEIEALKQGASRVEANLELEYHTLIDELLLKLGAVEQKFELLQQANDDKWEEFKTELELGWDSLRELVKAITSP